MTFCCRIITNAVFATKSGLGLLAIDGGVPADSGSLSGLNIFHAKSDGLLRLLIGLMLNHVSIQFDR